MSKSKGNYYTFRDITAKVFTGWNRYFVSVPYNKQLTSFDALVGAEKTAAGLRDFRAVVCAKTEKRNGELHDMLSAFGRIRSRDGRRPQHVRGTGSDHNRHVKLILRWLVNR